MNKFMEFVELAVMLVLVVALIAVLSAYPTMLLWNWLMPVIFGLPIITLWQALGLVTLSSILFRSTSSSKK